MTKRSILRAALCAAFAWPPAGNTAPAAAPSTAPAAHFSSLATMNEQLKATSPILQASRTTRPLLLAHGGVDRRLPILHATKLPSALEASHTPVTWIEHEGEAHGWHQPDTRISQQEAV